MMFFSLPCFYLPFAFTIIHGSRRPANNGEGLGAFITWVDIGGRSQYSNMCILNLKVSFFRSRRVVSITLPSGVRNCNRALERMIQCIVLSVGPLPPTSNPPRIHLTSFTWWMLPGLPHSSPAVYCEHKRGRPGNKARCLVALTQFSAIPFLQCRMGELWWLQVMNLSQKILIQQPLKFFIYLFIFFNDWFFIYLQLHISTVATTGWEIFMVKNYLRMHNCDLIVK